MGLFGAPDCHKVKKLTPDENATADNGIGVNGAKTEKFKGVTITG